MVFGIASSRNWRSVVPVEKGWSEDRKYRIETETGRLLLLRLSEASRQEEKRKEFGIITKYARTGITMSAPVEFGLCSGGEQVYMLLEWIDGRDLEEALPELSEEELAVYRRGKNAKPEHGAKNASSLEYHKATGLEALIGSLYLEGKTERILELIRKGMSYAGED